MKVIFVPDRRPAATTLGFRVHSAGFSLSNANTIRSKNVGVTLRSGSDARTADDQVIPVYTLDGIRVARSQQHLSYSNDHSIGYTREKPQWPQGKNGNETLES